MTDGGNLSHPPSLFPLLDGGLPNDFLSFLPAQFPRRLLGLEGHPDCQRTPDHVHQAHDDLQPDGLRHRVHRHGVHQNEGKDKDLKFILKHIFNFFCSGYLYFFQMVGLAIDYTIQYLALGFKPTTTQLLVLCVSS